MRRYPVFCLLFMILLATPSFAADRQEATGPAEQVRQTIERATGLLQDRSLPDAQRRERLSALLRSRFDFSTMARGVLNEHWAEAAPQQRERFVELFADLLEATYLGRIEAYAGERVEISGERREGDLARVDTVIHTAHISLPVSYQLLLKGQRWLVYDLSVGNVGLVRNFRSTYGAIVRRQGMEGLLSRMASKIEELRPEKNGRIGKGGQREIDRDARRG